MASYLLSIGSNCPGAHLMMKRAAGWLGSNFAVTGSSGIYSSAALNPAAGDYLNMVVRVESALPPAEVTALAKAFEAECGRTPQSKLRGCVEMDVDVVQVDAVILRPVEFTRPYFMQGLGLMRPAQS